MLGDFHFSLKTPLSALLLSVAIIPSSSIASGSEIYKHTDEQGRVTYSDQKQDNNQNPVELPELGDDSQYLQIKAPAKDLQTCERRGGIDCNVRIKEDGVQCIDGSISLSQSYAEHCLEAKIEDTLFVEFATEPQLKPHDRVYHRLQARDRRTVTGLLLEVRNISPVEATIESVVLKLPFLAPRNTPFQGAKRIAPYGLEQFYLSAKDFPKGTTPRHLAEAKVVLDCSNCASALK